MKQPRHLVKQPPSPIAVEFERHLKRQGLAPATMKSHMVHVRAFLRHVGDQPLDRVSEDVTRSFFDRFKGNSKKTVAHSIKQLLTFAASRLPAPVVVVQPPAIKQDVALDKLLEQKQRDDDLVAKLARKLIDHYLYFQGRTKGQPENLDDVYRFADECKALIEANLPLFMGLSAGGRNVHSKIDERVQR